MTKQRVPRVIVVAGTIIALALIGVLLAFGWPEPGWYNYAQAHDDGTNHIHPTPTPTPAPLKGQPQMVSSAKYNLTTHTLDFTSRVIDAPKREDGWYIGQYGGDRVQHSAEITYQGWSSSSRCDAEYQEPVDDATHGVAQCSLPLPDHWDLEKVSSSIVVPVGVSGPYFYRKHGEDPVQIGMQATLYVDLFVRDNWTE